MTNPYVLDRPAIISFSGGRTSGFMLREVLDAFGGQLPDNVRAVFCNTGLEHEGTLRFVADVAAQWGVPIAWLEYRAGRTFVAVDFATASRAGEPYDALIADKHHLPNLFARFCTTELKINTMRRFADALGWEAYTNAVGLRADEPHRVARLKGDRDVETVVTPMYRAGHSLVDVRAFWRRQSFDLQLPFDFTPAFGNCVGCFLKADHKLQVIAQRSPEHLAWWHAWEQRPIGSEGARRTFRGDRLSYGELLARAEAQRAQGDLFPETTPQDATDDLPCMCSD